jgi:hypothetical protein
MARDRFLIAPFTTGWEKDLKPWLIPDEAFVELRNAYVQYGRVTKRVGSQYTGMTQLQSRLRLFVGTTNGSGNISSGADPLPALTFAVGQSFSIGSQIFTVTTSGSATMLCTSGTPTVKTFNTANGAYDIQGSLAATAVYFYPAQPVMGFALYEQGSIKEQTAFAFDQQSVYKYVSNQWLRETDAAAAWTSSDSQFFWSTNWRGAAASDIILFTTNFKAADLMKYYTGSAWASFQPKYLVAGGAGDNAINTARIIVPFKNRLLLLNTIEGSTNVAFVNRCRYSQNGSPLATGAFYEQNQVGALGGGFIDAPTSEEIVSAEFLKDRLIVYFERSTWELAYTGNEVLPFVWQKINTELGAQSTFSSVPFDKAVLNVGDSGFHACNGYNVDRIDERIQKEVFTINNSNNGLKRVHGIRDYYEQLVYWTYPSVENTSSQVFPDAFFTYNYENQTWSVSDDTFTCFGYFEQQMGLTWEQATMSWQEANFTWGSGLVQARARRVCAGNQQGYVLLLSGELSSNAGALQITNISYSAPLITITAINHNFRVGDYVKIEGALGITGLENIYKINSVPTVNTFTLIGSFTGIYTGGGTLARISEIYIRSKEWNPYIDKGLNVAIDQIDFQVNKTSGGAVTIDYTLSSAEDVSMSMAAQLTGSALGDNVLSTAPYAISALEQQQERLNHAVYFQGAGQFFQMVLYLSDEQLRDVAIAESGFMLHSLILYAQPAGRLSSW